MKYYIMKISKEKVKVVISVVAVTAVIMGLGLFIRDRNQIKRERKWREEADRRKDRARIWRGYKELNYIAAEDDAAMDAADIIADYETAYEAASPETQFYLRKYLM